MPTESCRGMSLLSTITINVPPASLDLTPSKLTDARVSAAVPTEDQAPPEAERGEEDTEFSTLLAIIVPDSDGHSLPTPSRLTLAYPSMFAVAELESDSTDSRGGSAPGCWPATRGG